MAINASAQGTGFKGKTVEPVLVPILSLVTFGIYTFFWNWRVTKEIDAASGSKAHSLYKVALIAFVASVALYMLGFSMFMRGFAAAASGEEGASSGGAGLTMLMLGGLAVLASFVLYLITYWRVFKGLEAAEQRIAAPEVASPGLLLALMLIPFVNIVGIYYVQYRVQKGLNGLWSAPAPARAVAPPPAA